MSYFVTVDGVEVSGNIGRDAAIKRGIKLASTGSLNVGIGRYKRVRGKILYNLLPLNFYL
jgi:uncharacterized membrane protein